MNRDRVHEIKPKCQKTIVLPRENARRGTRFCNILSDMDSDEPLLCNASHRYETELHPSEQKINASIPKAARFEHAVSVYEDAHLACLPLEHTCTPRLSSGGPLRGRNMLGMMQLG